MSDTAPERAALAERVSRLEERLAALESNASQRSAAPDRAATTLDPEVFWALEGLKARTSDEDGAVLFTGSVRLPTGERFEWQQGLATEALLETDWSLPTDALAALGHPIRLVLLRAVLHGARTVTELGAIEELGTSGQLYHHLRPLVSAGWLRTVGRGRYEVPGNRVVPLLVVVAAAQR
jgi:DNA-binding transcriptional ArsR family regulator